VDSAARSAETVNAWHTAGRMSWQPRQRQTIFRLICPHAILANDRGRGFAVVPRIGLMRFLLRISRAEQCPVVLVLAGVVAASLTAGWVSGRRPTIAAHRAP
jgi:hypothetical protein